MSLLGMEAFPGLSPLLIGALILIYFGSALVRGLLGFGSGAPTLLFSAFILPPHEAVILSVFISTFAMLTLMPAGLRYGNIRIASPVMIGFALASILGVWAFANLRADWLTLVLGVLLILATLGDLTDCINHFTKNLNVKKPSVPLGLGFISGFLGSIGGAGVGYFLSVYVRWATNKPEIFRGTNILLSTFTNIWRVALFAIFGLLAWHYAVALVFFAPAVLAGNFIGAKAADRLSSQRYFRIFQLVLLIGAIILTIKGIRGLI
ncbi:MAG: hypothetical protein CMM76_11120 [Rhodospirillaceae bacterium]|nr:hypothetical protein [Rhodospirillaceae bacterium]|tara:strand:- start:713 stop:1504 length:792 start_codon:yes stop_codon:yes gene_type:complete